MLTYNFLKNKVPLYEQLYEYIRNDIVSGTISAHEKLPSRRTFAANNGISVITVQNAYDRLISEGYVYSRPGRGYYAAEIPETAFSRADTAAAPLPEEEDKHLIDFSDNRTRPENFPFSVWAKLSREVLSTKERELTEISPAGGVEPLRRAVARHLKSFRGMSVDPDRVVVGAGSEYLYGVLFRLLGADKTYCTENPGYKKLERIYALHNISRVWADMDDKGISAEELRRTGAEVAHITPNHHFPTGITMPAGRRYELLAWANEVEGRYIIEDDYDSEFRTSGKPMPTLSGIDGCGKVVYMNTFSKSLTPTIRIGYMVLPATLANRFRRDFSGFSCTVSNFEQYTLAEFISRGYFEKHINRTRSYYSKLRESLIRYIGENHGDVCRVTENDSGLHFLIEIATSLSDEEVRRRAEDRGIRIKSLSDYDFGGGGGDSHRFLINYSRVDEDTARNALRELFARIRE
ncbi:MAG: PLP-dependent aminotransferase family protein [Abditibacteriota bacterium]|nr:PLP-dependent aminotransferase family protein [Abditibacteriota bacterium]